MSIQQLYFDAIEYEQQIIIDILDLLVIEKKLLSWNDGVEALDKFLKPEYNKRFHECFKEMGRR